MGQMRKIPTKAFPKRKDIRLALRGVPHCTPEEAAVMFRKLASHGSRDIKVMLALAERAGLTQYADALRAGRRVKIGVYPATFTPTNNGETLELARAVDEAMEPVTGEQQQ